jgi:hypothetical protein
VNEYDAIVGLHFLSNTFVSLASSENESGGFASLLSESLSSDTARIVDLAASEGSIVRSITLVYSRGGVDRKDTYLEEILCSADPSRSPLPADETKDDHAQREEQHNETIVRMFLMDDHWQVFL